MIVHPRVGQIVQCWYRAALRPIAPLHGLQGVVEAVGRTKPRNHAIRVAGTLYVVPAGHLRPPGTTPATLPRAVSIPPPV
jgi:hypothetical protein